jgi:hypothetical protein
MLDANEQTRLLFLPQGMSVGRLMCATLLPNIEAVCALAPASCKISQELMSQAAWNLCPQKTRYDSACYFEQDRPFDAISGSVHMTLADVPDGTWTLALKRDLMSKIRGAVRSSVGVARAAAWTKVRSRWKSRAG